MGGVVGQNPIRLYGVVSKHGYKLPLTFNHRFIYKLTYIGLNMLDIQWM
jgi:hypothetical protein